MSTAQTGTAQTGIRPKVVTQGRQFDEHAKRYIFFPTSNLDFSGSQAISPIWEPKIRKGRITLLESFPYFTQVENENERENGVMLGQKIMGTDAQVRFIMGNAEGSGYMEKGMVELEDMVDLDTQTAIEIEQILLGGETPKTLLEFRTQLSNVVIPEDFPALEIAEKVLAILRQSVETAIRYCTTYCIQLETELAEGRSGRIGIKYLSSIHQYYFTQINRPLPDDRAGVNAGQEMSKTIQQLVSAIQGQNDSAPQTEDLQAKIERDELQKKVEALEKEAGDAKAELEKAREVITTLTEEEA